MLKIWNVVLICITFLLTIFGTFLTRSGLISSVHSFAQSDIGIFFVWFMGFIIATTAGLIVWRLPLLRSRGQVESLISREAAFVVNNWVLLGCATFIAVATTFPKVSEWLWSEEITVGPPFFNRWMTPLGLALLLLMGVAPLFGWRKTSGVSLKRASAAPLAVMAGAIALHLAFGSSLGFPALVEEDQFYPGVVGVLLQKIGSAAPLITVALVFFNFGVIGQEYYRGVAARRRKHDEGVLTALGRLVQKSRRRYGGYIVHAGVGLMFLGFTGKAWEIEQEASMMPGQEQRVGDYTFVYEGPRMEVDPAKRMIFGDLTVKKGEDVLGQVSPARFIYKRSQQPTTEAGVLHQVRDDLYVVVGQIDPSSKRATFRFHVNPLVNWIWLGVLVLMSGAVMSLWPEMRFARLGAWSYVRATAGATSGIAFAILWASTSARSAAPTESVVGPSAVASTRTASVTGELPPLTDFAPAGAAAATGLLIGGAASRRRRDS